MRVALAVALALPLAAGAQEITQETLPSITEMPLPDVGNGGFLLEPADPSDSGGFLGSALPEVAEVEERPTAVSAEGALLRGLDKVSGDVIDLELRPGESGRVGRLAVALTDCRFPEGDPASDAFAWLDVTDPSRGSTLFSGWMVASSPALNPLDHPRYDVWVLRCITS